MVAPNKSELVELLLDAGVPAHRGMDKNKLLDLWQQVQEQGYAEGGESNPIDQKRDEMMEFFERYRESLLPQLGCDGNCYKHPDSQVMLCWLDMKGTK